MSDQVIDIDAIKAARSGSDQPQKDQPVNEQPTTEPVDETPKDEPVDDDQPVDEPTDDSPQDEPADDQPKDEPLDGAPKDEPVDDGELDLDAYEVEVDGKSRTVSELLDERDALAERVAAVEQDEFLMRFIAHRQAGGDPKEFLESQTADWDKADAVSVLKQKFFKEYSDVDAATRELMFQKELRSKYNIDPNASEEDVDTESHDYKIGQALLKRDADKARATFKEEQKKFAIPEKQVAQQPQAYDQAAVKKKIESNESIAKFSADKLLKLEVKNDEGNHFGYEVENPASIIEMMTDDRQFWKQFIGKDGKPDLAKQAKVYAFASDPEKFEQNLIAIGKSLGTEKILKEKRNTDGVLNKGPKAEIGGDKSFKDGFLKAARQQKQV